jgi:hypothetical protein
MSWRTVHMCLDIRGALKWPKRRLKGMLVDELGRRLSADEVREALLDELVDGKRVLPLGPPCDGFDYVTGCPGHPLDEPKHISEVKLPAECGRAAELWNERSTNGGR